MNVACYQLSGSLFIEVVVQSTFVERMAERAGAEGRASEYGMYPCSNIESQSVSKA